MPKRIYVGNLPADATTSQVKALFAQYGRVTSVSISGSRATVEMSSDSQAQTAVNRLQNARLGRNSLNVNEA